MHISQPEQADTNPCRNRFLRLFNPPSLRVQFGANIAELSSLELRLPEDWIRILSKISTLLESYIKYSHVR